MKTANLLLRIMGCFMLFMGLLMLYGAVAEARDKRAELAITAALFIQFALIDFRLAVVL